MGIVGALREHARSLLRALPLDSLLVIYGEVYGRNIGAAAKNYTSLGEVGFRVFDAFQMSLDAVFAQIELPIERISLWRENGGQPFHEVPALDQLALALGFERVPPLGVIAARTLPQGVVDAAEFLDAFTKSAAQLDPSALGRSEGIVIRSFDRGKIAKLRFEDYRRTLKR